MFYNNTQNLNFGVLQAPRLAGLWATKLQKRSLYTILLPLKLQSKLSFNSHSIVSQTMKAQTSNHRTFVTLDLGRAGPLHINTNSPFHGPVHPLPFRFFSSPSRSFTSACRVRARSISRARGDNWATTAAAALRLSLCQVFAGEEHHQVCPPRLAP